MNKEKIDLSKPKKEYKKFQKESESLVEEVKDDEVFKKSAISSLKYDIKSGKNSFGSNANCVLRYISSYKNLGIFEKEADEILKKVLDDEKFKKEAISDLEDDIKSGKNGNGGRANWALRTILNYKNLGIFDKKVVEKLKEILDNEKFKKSAIRNLENRIRSGKDSHGWNTNWALWAISSYKNLGIFEKEVKEKLKDILDDKDFKKTTISNLEDNIKSGQNSNRANLALKTILAYKDISEYFKDLADQKIAKNAR